MRHTLPRPYSLFSSMATATVQNTLWLREIAANASDRDTTERRNAKCQEVPLLSVPLLSCTAFACAG